MRDGMTQKVPRASLGTDFATFRASYQATIVVVAGPAAGEQFTLESECVTLGRGPGVDRTFDDPSMSRQHAAIDYVDGNFRIRDLGSTNGVELNGAPATSADLRHGDRFAVGDHEFQLVIEEVEQTPDVYELDVD